MLLPEPVDCFEHRVALKILYLILRQSGIPVAVGVFNPFDDLKRQIVDRKGPYVELGVSQRSDGTLTANTLAFERELEAKGLDRMLVTRELSGFQVQPILSVDWSRSLFALAVSP